MTSLKHNLTNDHRFGDLIKEAREFGRDSAQGKDALPKLAMRVVRAANDGVIDLEKDKHGEGIDDARKLYDEYREAESKKAVHEHSSGGVKANASKLRAFVKMGVMTSCDPVAVIERVPAIRQALIDANQKVKPAYHAYVEVARATIEADGDLTDEQIRACCVKGEAEEPTVEKVLTGVVKKLEKLITGEGGVKDQDERVIQAHDVLRDRLAALLTDRNLAEKRAMYEALRAELEPEAVEADASENALYDELAALDAPAAA